MSNSGDASKYPIKCSDTVDETGVDGGSQWNPSGRMQDLIDKPIEPIVYNDWEFNLGMETYTNAGQLQDRDCLDPKLSIRRIGISPNFAKSMFEKAVLKNGEYFNRSMKYKGSEFMRAAEIMAKLLQMLGTSNDVFEVSEYQKLWDRKLKEHGFIPDRFAAGDLLRPIDKKQTILVIDKLNDVFREVSEEGQSPAFKQLLSRRQQNADRRVRSIQKWLAKCFDRHSRLLVLRLDLHIRKHERSEITPVETTKMFQKFIRGLQERAQLTKGFVGYASVLEYGLNHNYHRHTLILYDAAVRENASVIATSLSSYWQEVTDGKGYAFDCSRSRNAEAYRGIGAIHYTDEVALNELFTKVVPYMCKRDEFFRVLPGKARGLLRSEMKASPRYERKKTGRLRQSESAPTLERYSSSVVPS